MNHYTYRAESSREHGEYVGRCLKLPWLSRWAPTLPEATNAIEQAVDEFVAERKAAGEDLPTPLTDRQCSGKFVVPVVQKLSESLGRPTLSDLLDLD